MKKTGLINKNKIDFVIFVTNTEGVHLADRVCIVYTYTLILALNAYLNLTLNPKPKP